MKYSKLDIASVLKGLMIVLVVVGHSSIVYTNFWSPFPPAESSIIFSYLTKYLDSFHTYALVFASGLIYYSIKYEQRNYKNDMMILNKKVKRLIVPYFITLFIWAIPMYMLLVSTDRGGIFHKFILGESPSQLWFLLMLFWVFIMSIGIEKISTKLYGVLNERQLGIIVIVIGYGMSFLSLFCSYCNVPNFFSFLKALSYYLYFALGMLFSKYFDIIQNRYVHLNNKGLLFLACLFCSIALFVLDQIEMMPRIISYLIQPIGVLISIMAALIVSNASINIIRKNSVIKKIWTWFSTNSFTIYLVHQQFIYLSLKIINRPGICPSIVVLFNFIFCMAFSCIMCLIINRFNCYNRKANQFL